MGPREALRTLEENRDQHNQGDADGKIDVEDGPPGILTHDPAP